MSWGLTAVAAATVATGYMASNAASEAAEAQSGSAEAGVAEQRRQFDAIRKLLEPYVAAGTPALEAQQAMLGLGGAEAEAAQIAAVERSPTFQAMLRQGEEALLQRASATGGLRGGNIQAALAQFRPQLLAQELGSRYARLGDLTTLGQQSAVGVGNAGMTSAANVATLLGRQGAAQAAGAIGQAQAYGGTLSGLSNLTGQYFGRQALANQNIAAQFGTTPGSQQTAMLQAQQAGF